MYCCPINCLFQTKPYNTSTSTPMPSCRRTLNGDSAAAAAGLMEELKLMLPKPVATKKTKNNQGTYCHPKDLVPALAGEQTLHQITLVYCNHQHRKTSRFRRSSNLSVTLKIYQNKFSFEFWPNLIFFISNTSFATIDTLKEKKNPFSSELFTFL